MRCIASMAVGLLSCITCITSVHDHEIENVPRVTDVCGLYHDEAKGEDLREALKCECSSHEVIDIREYLNFLSIRIVERCLYCECESRNDD